MHYRRIIVEFDYGKFTERFLTIKEAIEFRNKLDPKMKQSVYRIKSYT